MSSNILNGALGYMLPQREQTHITENYVSSPPALVVVDESNTVWTLGMEARTGPRGEYAFAIQKNGVPVGEWGSRIERRGGKIRIFTVDGWKRWTGKTFL